MRLSAISLVIAIIMSCLGIARDAAAQPWPEPIQKLMARPDQRIDFLQVKLAVDKVIDPTSNSDAVEKEVEGFVGKIRTMLPPGMCQLF
jgi:hypothetical protein